MFESDLDTVKNKNINVILIFLVCNWVNKYHNL